jgi:hypothetical protein
VKQKELDNLIIDAPITLLYRMQSAVPAASPLRTGLGPDRWRETHLLAQFLYQTLGTRNQLMIPKLFANDNQ